MLTVGKLVAGPTVGRYYVDQVAQGLEDYYAGEGEAAGAWLGTGAAWLGLSGEVSEEDWCGCSKAATRTPVCCCDRRARRVQWRGLI